MIKPLRVVIKVVLLLLSAITFFTVSGVVRILWREFNSHRVKQLKVCRFYSSIALKIGGIKVVVINKPPVSWSNHMYVGNHMGFVDVLAMLSTLPPLFVTSIEMLHTPGLGLLTEMGCCLYVERRDRSNIGNEKAALVKALKEGFNVMLYPEGKAGDGSEVSPFKRTLMMAAAEAEIPLFPVVFNFRKVNSEDFSYKWRDHLCWYGDLSFVTHIIKLMSLKSAELELKFLMPVKIHSSENKAEVAERMHKIISAEYTKIKGP